MCISAKCSFMCFAVFIVFINNIHNNMACTIHMKTLERAYVIGFFSFKHLQDVCKWDADKITTFIYSI